MGVDIKTNQGPLWTALALMMEPASSSENTYNVLPICTALCSKRLDLSSTPL